MSDERTFITNGQFIGDLDDWTATGATYSAGDGDAHYGVAALNSNGHSIAQEFDVSYLRAHTLHLALKCASAVTSGQVTVVITDEDGGTLTTLNPTLPANSWTEFEYSLGLAPGITYTLTVTRVSAGAAVKVDDVWLWAMPATRAQLAAKVHAKLARLAIERELSPSANGDDTEGSYTHAVDVGLRAVGAIHPDTDAPDPRWIDSSLVDACLDAIEQEMLELLQRDYSVETDISVDGRSESRSQVASALEKIAGAANGGGARRIVTRKLTHAAWSDDE